MVIAALAAAPLRARALTCAPVRALGTVSYGVYLWHFPVIVWLRSQQQWPADGLHAMARTAALTLLLATASWWLVERPAIAWAAARTGRRRRAAAPAPGRPPRAPLRSPRLRRALARGGRARARPARPARPRARAARASDASAFAVIRTSP